jgi:hypothetical protein
MTIVDSNSAVLLAGRKRRITGTNAYPNTNSRITIGRFGGNHPIISEKSDLPTKEIGRCWLICAKPLPALHPPHAAHFNSGELSDKRRFPAAWPPI